ncbi:hypothetical protein R6Q59_007327 [Mikania micrantha]
MAITKTFVPFFLLSMLLLAQAHEMIVVLHVRRGVGYHHGQTCATGHVGLVVLVATVCHQGLQATKSLVLVTIS